MLQTWFFLPEIHLNKLHHLATFEVNQKSGTLFPWRPKLANLKDFDGHVTKPVHKFPMESSGTEFLSLKCAWLIREKMP